MVFPQAPAAEVAQPGHQPPAQQGWIGSLAGIVRMGIFWYLVMQMFGLKKVTNPDLLTNNLFIKGEKLVILMPLLFILYSLSVFFSRCHIGWVTLTVYKLKKRIAIPVLYFDTLSLGTTICICKL